MSTVKSFSNQYECIRLSYFEGGKVLGSTQVNSISSIEYYTMNLHDSIIIQNTGPIGKLCSKFPSWQEPISYSRTSGYYYLPSKHFYEFLDCASQNQEFMKGYYFSQSDFDKIANKLGLGAIPVVNVGFTDKEYDKYLEIHGSVYEFKERIMHYYTEYKWGSVDSMLKLLKICFEKQFITDDDNIISMVLERITYLSSILISLSLLECESIVNILKNSPYIQTVSVFEGSWLKWRTNIWKGLLEIITNAPNLKEICFNSTWSTRHGDQFPSELLPSLSEAIKSRTSLEKIELTDNRWYQQKSIVLLFLEDMQSVPGLNFINLFGSFSRNDLPTGLPFKVHTQE